MKKYLLYLIILLFIGCGKIEFDGETFYTVKGILKNTSNEGVPNINLSLYNLRSYSPLSILGNFQENVISAKTISDKDGNFKLVFPKSNGQMYLQLPDSIMIINSLTGISTNTNKLFINETEFKSFLYDIKIVKVKTR